MAEYAATVTLALAGGGAPPAAWHGWLYRALGERGDAYHRAGRPPFALQPLPGWDRVRAVLLDGGLAGTLGIRPGAEGPCGRPIREAAWALRPYQALLAARAAPAAELTLAFVTPVAFKQGPYSLPVPLPRLVFSGLKRVWDQFAGLDLPGFDAAACERHVEITRLELATAPFDTGLGALRGSVGRVTYRSPDPELAGALRVLAAFAELAGAGVKRAFGMGVVRLVPAGALRGVSGSPTRTATSTRPVPAFP